MRLAEENEWVIISSKGEVRTTEYVVSHLKPGIDYFFRVTAVNCAGRGKPLEMIEPVQAKDILGMICKMLFCYFSVVKKDENNPYFYYFEQRKLR